MKVLGLSGSMRKDGNTALLVKEILKPGEAAGIETEFVSLAGKKILPCLGCGKCKEKKWCVIEGDDWGAIAQKMIDCEVLVIGSPVYYYDVCGQLKNFIDRTYSLYHDRKLAGRRGIAVAVNASAGADRAVKTIEGFLNSHELASLGAVTGKGFTEGEVMDDDNAMAHAKVVGDKIVRLLRPRHD
ncbi:flavodoxin family protein [Methanoregula sp. UBA64]|jgi:multimeric flavodoxin WrbA|uniref:flavodoxin family protein n=1 Tax=Methanoregula sp. UBA64 TaxID=1915554 RepID=UPI0025E2FAD3|nr:flavodoxin family protein [Methanoregula sp. UBA64]